jgi:hypothetical protein
MACAALIARIYYKNNKSALLAKSKQYSKENPEINRKAKKKYRRMKRETDSVFRFRSNISRQVRAYFKQRGSTKKGNSFIANLPYSLEELKTHIELLFEPWMNWGNQGRYSSKTWDDNNPLTWTWQLDHIVPHSIFHYENTECEQFKKCWSLSNLRPLSAKQNNLDGCQKRRHNVVE